MILRKHQLDVNPAVVIVPLPLKATSWIWIYPGLTFKLKLAVFNCATKSVSLVGMSPEPFWNIREYCFLSWRGKIIKTNIHQLRNIKPAISFTLAVLIVCLHHAMEHTVTLSWCQGSTLHCDNLSQNISLDLKGGIATL